MAQIKFFANVKPETAFNEQNQIITSDSSNEINHGAGSGLGFYGNGFRVSVPVDSQQDQTYVTNDLGTAQGARLNNTAMDTEGDGSTEGKVAVNGGQPINLSSLPNMACPLNIRFTTQQLELKIASFVFLTENATIDDPANEVTTYVYEARHPSNLETAAQLEHRAYDSNGRFEFDPDATTVADMELTASPGNAGTNSGGENTTTQSEEGLGYK